MKYYVDAAVSASGCGTKEQPFKTIQEAADLARPGDEILVAPGIYREYVNPKCGGEENARITYRSTDPLGAVITGAEPLSEWSPVPGMENVWSTRISNRNFGTYNPYTTKVSGDWLEKGVEAHTGDVYLNHKSMYEVFSMEQIKNPVPYQPSWDCEFSTYVWLTEQDKDKDETIFFANFQGLNPNEEEVECSVRRNCFLPEVTGINYITLSGFTVREAATQWAPPTAYQDGMVGPHWSKGWVIEDCEIYESKCSGISLGKYLQPNNENKWLHKRYKDGTQTQRECVCQAIYEGWDKEHIGSHVVRRCDIHDCGQTGIVGHLGCVFSIIEENHIHHINNKHNLSGAEIGGIKFHGAIDTIIRNNHIHHCTRGIWLDWQAQGTRVSQNLFHDNCLGIDRTRLSENAEEILAGGVGEDIFLEVSHGPTLVDNNIMLSERAVKFPAQGAAFVRNLFAGALAGIGTGTDNGAPDIPSNRYTPYHEPHSTKLMGFMTFLHGDVRFYQNIFVQKPILPLFEKMQRDFEADPDNPIAQWDTMNFVCGTHVYDGYPTFEEWDSWFEGYCGMGSEPSNPNRYYDHLPVWMKGNVYLGGAKHWEKEENAIVNDSLPVKLELTEENGTWNLRTNIFEAVPNPMGEVVTTEMLGMAFEPEERFENPDGSPITLDKDLWSHPLVNIQEV